MHHLYFTHIWIWDLYLFDTFKKSDVGYAEPDLLPAKQEVSLLLISCVCRLVLALTGLSLYVGLFDFTCDFQLPGK